jgi:hypothetical protein
MPKKEPALSSHIVAVQVTRDNVVFWRGTFCIVKSQKRL